MKSLYFDFRDIFKANRLGFSIQRILVQFVGISIGYSVYLILTYLSLILSGHSLSHMWKQMGVFPCIAGYNVNIISWITFDIGALFLIVALLIANTASSRAVYMILRGNFFYTWKESYRFAIKKIASIIFAPISLAILIGLLLALPHRAGFFAILSDKIFSVNINYPRVWDKLFIENENNFFRFKMSDGTIYYGKVNEYSKDPNYNDKEVLLERCAVVVESKNEIVVVRSYEFSYLSYEDIITIDVLPEEIEFG